LQQAQAELRTYNQQWGQKHAGEYDKDPNAYNEKFRKDLEEASRDYTSKIDSYNAAIETDYQLKKNVQQNLAINLSRVSPASALSFGTMSLAQTGVDDYDRFLSSVRVYKREYTKWLISKGSQAIRFKSGETVKVDIDNMPRHKIEPENVGASLARAIPDFAIMFVMIIVFFAGAYYSFRRYDVR
jgi:hypothetical protein